MLTLAPGCACDVCAEEYGPNRPPHAIPCGHVFCQKCCTTIVEKTSSRHPPACPFCREPFTADDPRLIRMDFGPTSGWSTPRRFPPAMDSFSNAFNTEVLQRKTERLVREGGATRSQLEVRRLEDSVSRIAAKKCSVEEVSQLYKELEDFLLHEKDDPTTSLFLSAALLRAILMNHLAHSEASKSAKTTEANLKAKIDELDQSHKHLESELRRQRTLYAEKSQECQQLRHEVSQFRALASISPSSSTPSTPGTVTPDRCTSPIPNSTSPTPYSSASAQARAHQAQSQAQTPLSRFSSMHARSASMSSRPTTPAVSSPVSPTRGQTPGPGSVAFPSSSTSTPSSRSYTPAPRSHTPSSSASAAAAAMSSTSSPLRSHTPSLRSATPGVRSYTPGPLSHSHSHSSSISAIPPVPPMPRFNTPAPTSTSSSSASAAAAHAAAMRAQTPAPLIPPKPRRLSQPSPPKMMARSTSEEKYEAHERWIPPQAAHQVFNEDAVPPPQSGNKRDSRQAQARPASRAGFAGRLFKDIF